MTVNSHKRSSSGSDPEHEAQMARLQTQLSNRRAREAAWAREQEFLRTSLRSSERLKALAKTSPGAAATAAVSEPPAASNGVVNDAFEHDDSNGGATLPRRPVLLVDVVSDILDDLRSDDDEEDFSQKLEWLQRYVQSPEVRRACDVESRVASTAEHAPAPVSQEGVTTLEEVELALESASPQRTMSWRHQVEELRAILSKEDFRALLEAHDGASKYFVDVSPADSGSSEMRPPPPGFESINESKPLRQTDSKRSHSPAQREVEDDFEDSDTEEKRRVECPGIPDCYAEYQRSGEGILLKTVVMQKNEEPLGATIRNEGEAVVVGRIVHGTLAHRSRLLYEGDEILTINALEVRGKDVNEVCDIIARLKGRITFIVVPVDDPEPYANGSVLGNPEHLQSEVHVKTLFSYNPEDDAYTPCKELGLSFERGDVLHVISREDPNWWQAYRDGEDSNAYAGLIPSPQFQKQREQLRLLMAGDAAGKGGAEEGEDGGCLACCRVGGRKGRKGKVYNPSEAEVSEASVDDLLTYEVVNLYYPQPRIKRPVVLIGPPNVGRHQLRNKLVLFDSERFTSAVIHTTSLAKPGETDGTYHHISKHKFEEMRNANLFVEWGSYDKNYYGTAVSSVRDVIRSGKVCVLALQPEAIKQLRQSELMPFIVFVAPPSGINAMRSLRRQLSGGSSTPQDDALLATIERGRKMEDEFGHHFDLTVVNADIDRSFHQLLGEINRLETEPQWVPIQWLAEYQNGSLFRDEVE